MCGRVRLSSDYSEIKIRLKFGSTAPAPNFEPGWNVPPTGPMLVATYAKGGERVSEIMRWGLLPGWAKDIKAGYSTFNARSEFVTTKPAFRTARKKGQRCLIVTDGFYEWRKSDKQPFAIGIAAGELMVMAGLWGLWTSQEGERIKSCTVITCEANDAVGALHDRMPVILAEGDWPKWLAEEPASEEELKALLVPCPSEELKLWPVDKRVAAPAIAIWGACGWGILVPQQHRLIATGVLVIALFVSQRSVSSRARYRDGAPIQTRQWASTGLSELAGWSASWITRPSAVI